MAEIKTIYKGESVTLLFTFPALYDMSRLTSHKIFVGETEFTGVVEGQTIKMQLKSSDTNRMIGTHRIVFLIDDTTLGLRKPYCGELVIAKTQASESNASVSNISDIIIPIVISETSITVGDVMYNYVIGRSAYQVWLYAGNTGTEEDYLADIKGDPFLYSDFTPEQIAELQQPATDAIASIEAVELAFETAEGLRVQAELNRQTNTSTAIQNAETATTNAGNAAILANEKAGLADSKATLADQKATLANDAANLANEVANNPDKVVADYWHKWNTTTKAYENTGIKAKGDTGAVAVVVGTTGTSDVNVMHQKAVTDELLNRPIRYSTVATLPANTEITIPASYFQPILSLEPIIVEVFCNSELKTVSAKWVKNNGVYDMKLTSTSLLVGAIISVFAVDMGVLSRGNTVGYKPVTPQTYDTNNNPTTVTVGATGANYTTINAAYAAVVAGSVIELIDDSTTMSGRLTLTKGVDANGKAIKIKGKSTKTTVTLKNDAFPIFNATLAGSIEFENIIFVEPTNTVQSPYLASHSGAGGGLGISRFINCEFNCIGYVSLTDVKEAVFDGVIFGNTTTAANAIGVSTSTAVLANDARIIVNSCTYNNTVGSGTKFISLPVQYNYQYNLVSVTNCDITTRSNCIDSMSGAVKVWSIKGNKFHSTINAAIAIGYEKTITGITGFTDWSAATSYNVGNYTSYRQILYKCKIANTNEIPNRETNINWERAKLSTGEISNNTCYRTTTVGSGHGIFIGWGVSDLVLENNIINNYWYNVVIKGYDNIIRYNCIGIDPVAPGLGIFTNDQKEVRNNTVRSNGSALNYGPNADTMEGLVETVFRDNIFAGINSSDLYSRWYTPLPAINNKLINNIYFGTAGSYIAGFNNTNHNLHTEAGMGNYKVATMETGAYIDPMFEGSDPLTQSYYKPTNPVILKMRDQYNQPIGAVDYTT